MDTTLDIRPATKKREAVLQRPPENASAFKRFITKFQAKMRVKKTIKALHEVEEIRKGKKKAKSFDEFLSEL